MSSVITLDFEKWKAQQTAAGHPVVLDEFVFAYVPNLDPSQAISRDEKLPAANHIVHRQAVNKTGLASENAVAYSVTLGTEVGHFDFNWIGLINKASGVIGMITHAPTQKKIKTANGLQGNVLTRSFLLEFEGAAKETAITTTAETWQIDFTARLTGMDEMQRLINTDSYGEAAFFGDSFAVIRNGDQYTVKKGLAYVGGLRGVLEFDQTLNSLRNTRVYADFSYQGNLVSQWKTRVKITASNNLKNYVDAAGYPHYVFSIASIDDNGDVIDLRKQGTLSDRDIAVLQKELGRIKQDYATQQALSAGLNGKQTKGDYATNSALTVVRENANKRLPNTGGVLTNNGRILELKNTTQSSLYIQGSSHDDLAKWRIGNTGANSDFALHNVLDSTYVVIANKTITVNGVDIINEDDLLPIKNSIDNIEQSVRNVQNIAVTAKQQADNANSNANNRLSHTGGTLTNNGNVLELKNTKNSSLYIQGSDHSGKARWRMGSPGVSDVITLDNVAGNTYLYIGNEGDVKINNNPVITGVRLGEMIHTIALAGQVTLLSDGHVCVGISKSGSGFVSHIVNRPVQYLIAGQWKTAEVFNGQI
ncbi:hypothetical protein Xbed_01642 [Xenorhabdus beddingii]|uniref:Phage tail fibre protein N-terminal domain-containing protein n=1 Tax=Xenorhabdus beddingii TaxID=40578 RepID=A0A1Y2SQ16_9GAMM|nr:phage tail protein [Xenorhabdus beddingii]OTA20168.1 hypothetical protein Xbed_01642 [Xenorhabdus beddingii]